MKALNKEHEYVLSVTIMRFEEIIGEQLRIPITPPIWERERIIDYEAAFGGFPF